MQGNFLTCKQENHNNGNIIGICVDPDCQEMYRAVCPNCTFGKYKLHQVHFQNLKTLDDFQEWMKEKITIYQMIKKFSYDLISTSNILSEILSLIDNNYKFAQEQWTLTRMNSEVNQLMLIEKLEKDILENIEIMTDLLSPLIKVSKKLISESQSLKVENYKFQEQQKQEKAEDCNKFTELNQKIVELKASVINDKNIDDIDNGKQINQEKIENPQIIPPKMEDKMENKRKMIARQNKQDKLKGIGSQNAAQNILFLCNPNLKIYNQGTFIKPIDPNEEGIAVSDHKITLNGFTKIAFHILQAKGKIRLGICSMDNVQLMKYLTDITQIDKGVYVIDNYAGIILNGAFFETQAFKFRENDIIIVTTDMEKQVIKWRKSQSAEMFEMKFDGSQTLHFCVVLKGRTQVEIITNQE